MTKKLRNRNRQAERDKATRDYDINFNDLEERTGPGYEPIDHQNSVIIAWSISDSGYRKNNIVLILSFR